MPLHFPAITLCMRSHNSCTHSSTQITSPNPVPNKSQLIYSFWRTWHKSPIDQRDQGSVKHAQHANTDCSYRAAPRIGGRVVLVTQWFSKNVCKTFPLPKMPCLNLGTGPIQLSKEHFYAGASDLHPIHRHQIWGCCS